MRVKIEDYRGFEIMFDTDNERFWAKTDDGAWHQKQSFAAAKKYVDDFIKDNEKFEPFFVIKKPELFHVSDNMRMKIVGIRKDGAFVSENRKKEKEQVSKYDEEYWILDKPENEKHYAAIAMYEAEKDQLDKKIKAEEGKIKSPTLTEIKKKMFPLLTPNK